jgi:hypothetical protein
MALVAAVLWSFTGKGAGRVPNVGRPSGVPRRHSGYLARLS